MKRRLEDARILMYSHDTFGLGHLRRCRTIAHALVEDYRGLNVLIISGATIAGAFDYRSRVDFVKVPSVIKLRDGEYTSMASHVALQETLKMRQSIIRHTAETFQPDVFIVDKEPMGLKGEVEETLTYLKARGTTLVLGMRDVMDAPHLLEAEWKESETGREAERNATRRVAERSSASPQAYRSAPPAKTSPGLKKQAIARSTPPSASSVRGASAALVSSFMVDTE